MSPGRRASLPPVGSERQVHGGHVQRLIHILTLEDNAAFTFDLSGMAGPQQLRIELGTAVYAWSSSSTGGRRTATVKGMRRALSAFLRWARCWNEENSGLADAALSCLLDVGPFHLQRYRRHLEDRQAYHTARCYYSDLCVLLRLAPGVSISTRREASKRLGPCLVAATPVRRYSHSEHSAIMHAARHIVMGAHARVTGSYALIQEHEVLTGLERAKACFLREILLFGRPQSRDGIHAMEAWAEVTPAGGLRAARALLFLSPDEVFAAAVLLACHRGLNLSPIVTTGPPMEHEPGVLQLDLDKPRRGPHLRFWPELFFENTAKTTDDKASSGAEALRLIAEATEPAREYLVAQNRESDRLLIYWPPSTAVPLVGIPKAATRNKAAWVPEGLTIKFPRLRRSIPAEGVAKEPTNHDPNTHLHYIRSDPDALLAAQEEASRGVEDMVEHARNNLAVRVAADEDTNADTDALLVNCADPESKPDTGLPCTLGFYSFLDCLECRNAATVPRLLPRQLAAQLVLEQLRDSIGGAWESRFAQRYYRLIAVINRHTQAELDRAGETAEEFIPVIVAALRHEVPS
jgi:hypothetical protein